MIVRYFNACNSKYNLNRIGHYDLALDKYWVIQGVYFILTNIVALGVCITDGKILFCHGVSYQSRVNKFSMREYNYRTVYD